jgi:subtilase family serine protease
MIRRIRTSLFTIAALVPAINIVQAASPSPATAHVRDVVASGQAKSIGRLPATQPMRLVLVLPHRNQAALESLLKDLYDPSSPSYHQFLTVDEFTSRFGPSQEDYDAVTSFAQSHGLTVVGTARNRMNVDVAGPVANVEEALHVTMGLYQHLTENRVFYSADREPTPDLPVALWHISGLDNYSIPQPALVHRSPNAIPNATTGSCPSASFCGSDMRAAYYGGSLTGTGQSLGLLEYAGTDLADLATYFTNAGQTNNVPITLLSTDGTSTGCLAANNCDDTEQTIDMTQAIGMAPGLSSLVMYVGSVDTAIFNAMATASPLNAQLSSSWTWTPADPSTDNPFFEEFAAQGQNLFQASGDSAAWRPTSAVWPADSVYVTTVGGTDLETSSAGGPWSSETAWANGGGGISPDKFPIPSWQTAAAAGCSKCSKTLRNGPDVSANANYTFYVCADQTTCTANDYGGTSFAAPMWAGYLALTNELRVSNGGTTLGFINPTIYTIGLSSSYDSDFHDITGGTNGYSATIGYDLATGWGSPNGSGLLNALAGSSTAPGFSLSASPGAVAVTQGGSGTSTITSSVTGGFDSAVTLSASGQPTGVTVGFNPSSITGNGTSTMTMNVATSTVAGTYTITVTGTSGSTTETTTVALTVKGPNPNFTISASPATITIAKGGSGTTTITTAVSGGFDSAIGLSSGLLGATLSVTFSPNSIPAPGAGKSTMTVRVSRTAALGNHTVTVTGSGGGVTHSTTVTVSIVQ